MEIISKPSSITQQIILTFLFLIIWKIFAYYIADGLDIHLNLFFASIVEVPIIYYFSHRLYKFTHLSVVVFGFLSIFILYASIPNLLVFLDIGEVFPFASRTISIGMLMQSISNNILCCIFFIGINKNELSTIRNKALKYFSARKISTIGKYYYLLFGFFLLSIYAYIYITSGTVELVGKAGRIDVGNSFETGKTWLIQYAFTCWIMVFISQISVNKKSFSHHRMLIAFTLPIIISFGYIYISVGNRRELVILGMFCFVIYSVLNRAKYIIIFLSGLFPFLIFMGLQRSLSVQSITDRSDIDILLNLVGEFIFPHFPLLDAIESSPLPLGGLSYISTPAILIPSFDLWSRPVSLAKEFSTRFSDGVMGFAYTPLAESFLNFSYLSILLYPLMLVVTIKLLSKYSSSVSMAALIPFIFSLDIARGEFSSLLIQSLIFIILIHFFMTVLTSKSYKKSPLYYKRCISE